MNLQEIPAKGRRLQVQNDALGSFHLLPFPIPHFNPLDDPLIFEQTEHRLMSHTVLPAVPRKLYIIFIAFLLFSMLETRLIIDQPRLTLG